MKITNKDRGKILSKYDLGKLKNSEEIKRRLSTLNLSLIIKTSKGKFFLKGYTKEFKKFRYHILKGLYLLLFLEKRKYPSLRVFKARNGKPYTMHKGTTFAIFEFIGVERGKILIELFEMKINILLKSLKILFKLTKSKKRVYFKV